MDSKRRELILSVADGKTEALPILYHLDGFIYADRMFTWLIRNNITGKKFIDIYIHEFKGSWLTLGKWIVMKINKEVEMTKVIAGKNYIPKN